MDIEEEPVQVDIIGGDWDAVIYDSVWYLGGIKSVIESKITV